MMELDDATGINRHTRMMFDAMVGDLWVSLHGGRTVSKLNQIDKRKPVGPDNLTIKFKVPWREYIDINPVVAISYGDELLMTMTGLAPIRSRANVTLYFDWPLLTIQKGPAT